MTGSQSQYHIQYTRSRKIPAFSHNDIMDGFLLDGRKAAAPPHYLYQNDSCKHHSKQNRHCAQNRISGGLGLNAPRLTSSVETKVRLATPIENSPKTTR